MRNTRKLFIVLALFFLSVSSNAQDRNIVLEYITGSWCSYCACAADTIYNKILPEFPDAVILAYHGGPDPYSPFPGDSIKQILGFTGYPTGIIDRVTSPEQDDSWYQKFAERAGYEPTCDMQVNSKYNIAEKKLHISVTAWARVELIGSYYVNLVLLEDSLVSPQTGSDDCPGSDTWVHNNVVRDMINGAYGDVIACCSAWMPGVPRYYDYTYNIPDNVNIENCKIAAVIYEYMVPLNKAQVQQADVVSADSPPTPVELTSFSFDIGNGNILLHWVTASETNNYGFEIQKSEDGNTFKKVGFIEGKGTTAEFSNYSFTDSPANGKVLYYRLKQIDFDGKAELSDILTVNISGEKSFRLSQNYPNPFNPSTVIPFSIAERSFVTLKIFNALGELVAAPVGDFLEAGIYRITYNADLPAGIYYTCLSVEERSETIKMILLK